MNIRTSTRLSEGWSYHATEDNLDYNTVLLRFYCCRVSVFVCCLLLVFFFSTLVFWFADQISCRYDRVVCGPLQLLLLMIYKIFQSAVITMYDLKYGDCCFFVPISLRICNSLDFDFLTQIIRIANFHNILALQHCCSHNARRKSFKMGSWLYNVQ